MTQALTRTDVDAWLGWYADAGADVWCADAPVDWGALPAGEDSSAGTGAGTGARAPAVARVAPAPAERAPAGRAAPVPRAPLASSAPPASAGVAAPAGAGLAGITPAPAASLEALQADVAAFEGCPLKATAKNLCFYRGVPASDLMIIGEAPGRDEDLAGKPFVGAAGQLLDRMLASIGRSERDVHITNVVYWRPPGNRVPTPLEVRACLPFLLRQMELVQPRAILTLGAVAAHNLLGIDTGITKLRGKWQTLSVGGRNIPLLPSLHPAYLLRTPIAKRQVWSDLLAIQAALAA